MQAGIPETMEVKEPKKTLISQFSVTIVNVIAGHVV